MPKIMHMDKNYSGGDNGRVADKLLDATIPTSQNNYNIPNINNYRELLFVLMSGTYARATMQIPTSIARNIVNYQISFYGSAGQQYININITSNTNLSMTSNKSDRIIVYGL